MSTRRDFLAETAFTACALGLGRNAVAAAASDESLAHRGRLNILILGATGFIGPHFVHAALERGHKVSVFVRRGSVANLPATVESLRGDRNGDLKSIAGRTWDAVLDLATYGPLWVRTLGQALHGRVRHYTFISTGDVYKDPDINPDGTNESSATVEWTGPGDPYSAAFTQRYPAQYGSLKVLCEREAERQFPGRALIVRPGYMVGAGDYQARFTYWVARIKQGGEILSPGEPLQRVQFIDVRDVADWVIRMAEQAATGTYNTMGPGGWMSLCEMLGGIRALFGTPTKFTWVSIAWLAEQDIVGPRPDQWTIWRFSRDDAFMSDKAIAKGLTYRPLSVTARDTLQWYESQPQADRRGIATGAAYDEKKNLKWIVTPWTEISQREGMILAHWHIHRARLQ